MTTQFVSCALKLRLRPAQERMLNRWLWHLTGVYNWALRRIELQANDKLYPGYYDLSALVNGHSRKIGIPSNTLTMTIRTAHDAWRRCFKRWARRPRLKGNRNRLNSIPFRGEIARVGHNRIQLHGLGAVKFHEQDIPPGRMKSARIIRRASGWYLVLVIEGQPKAIPHVSDESVGIDPGFSALVTLSTGEKVEHPRELQRSAIRLGQAQRGGRAKLAARLLERQANQRKDRNHKLSRRLVSENAVIAWSKDNHRAIARSFGKSVTSAAHAELEVMLAAKSSFCGRRFVAVSSRNSTKLCGSCGSLSGPSGYAGLKVREWRCACGALHDRDVNAAVNTLTFALGMSDELAGDGQSGTVR